MTSSEKEITKIVPRNLLNEVIKYTNEQSYFWVDNVLYYKINMFTFKIKLHNEGYCRNRIKSDIAFIKYFLDNNLSYSEETILSIKKDFFLGVCSNNYNIIDEAIVKFIEINVLNGKDIDWVKDNEKIIKFLDIYSADLNLSQVCCKVKFFFIKSPDIVIIDEYCYECSVKVYFDLQTKKMHLINDSEVLQINGELPSFIRDAILNYYYLKT